jgi:hypothetical protein
VPWALFPPAAGLNPLDHSAAAVVGVPGECLRHCCSSVKTAEPKVLDTLLPSELCLVLLLLLLEALLLLLPSLVLQLAAAMLLLIPTTLSPKDTRGPTTALLAAAWSLLVLASVWMQMVGAAAAADGSG